MQRLLKEVAHEYDLFFAGNRKEAPVAEARKLESLVRFYRNANLTKLVDQFRFTSFANNCTLHAERWSKWMRDQEGGRASDPRLMQAVQKGRSDARELDKGRLNQKVQPETKQPDAKKGREPKKPAAPEQPYRRLYDDFINAKLASGGAPEMDYSGFQKLVEKQKKAIQSKYKGREVAFSVSSKDGKVSLKAKVLKSSSSKQ